jgi:hypothetical protein
MVTAIEGATVNTLKSTNPSYQLLVGWKVVLLSLYHKTLKTDTFVCQNPIRQSIKVVFITNQHKQI